MVADEQEPAILGKLFRTLQLNVHPQQRHDRRNIELRQAAEVFGILLLGLGNVHRGAGDPQHRKGDCKQAKPVPHKAPQGAENNGGPGKVPQGAGEHRENCGKNGHGT